MVGASVGGGGVIVAAATGFGERGASDARQEWQRPADADVSTPHLGQTMLKECGAAGNAGIQAQYTLLNTTCLDIRSGILPG
jgi:hypothetical protein